MLGIFLQSFAHACVNLKLLFGEEAQALVESAPGEWYPADRFTRAVRSIEARYPHDAPIKERLGIEMMRLWYELGPGRSIVRRGVDFLHFQTGSGGYHSVVRGPSDVVGTFALASLDEASGRAEVRSSTVFDRTIERGVLLGGLQLAGDLGYVDVDNSADPSVFHIVFDRDRRTEGSARDHARQQAFWAATNEALARAYAELERQRAELDAAKSELVRLNTELEARVAAQVQEIVARASEVDVLNAQLRAQVRERSRELAAALERLAERGVPGTLEPGAELGGRVRIVRQIGAGGMGAVFLAQDLASEQLVAVKIMNPRATPTPQLLQRFVSEARAAAAVSHPAIVRSLAIDLSEDGRIYQVLEYVRGRTLADRLDGGSGTAVEAARLGAVVADALSAAHATGVVHRDVKPSNILLSREAPHVKIVDFGVAKLREPDADPAQPAAALTGTGELVGTPEYMSPEQALDTASVGPASDVYSLGVVLFKWLSGALPFAETSASGLILAHAGKPPPPLLSVAPHTPAPLATAVDRCLAKSPAARPSASELARELSAIADALDAPPAHALVERILAGDDNAVTLAAASTKPGF